MLPAHGCLFLLFSLLQAHGPRLLEAVFAGLGDYFLFRLARRLLGDSGHNQSYIRTVRGRGFEFAAPVTAQDEAQPAINFSQEQTQERPAEGVGKGEASASGNPAGADASITSADIFYDDGLSKRGSHFLGDKSPDDICKPAHSSA